jgi:K+-dependent Na+/Ca+ exchanger-like protein
LFLVLVAIFTIYNCIFDDDLSSQSIVRRLENVKSCDEIEKADPAWLAAFYSVGVLYTFLAIAIACDEFFVPALEEIASSRHLNLSMDVAGATLMAAGGSAPEFYSSLFGTFTESEIGFGTIIGSAVFNVLFVIAMCTILTKEELTLTWWPLFRDAVYYAIGLIVITAFIEFNSKEQIELWEACVLFAMYIGYILIMWKNADIYRYLTGKELEYFCDDDKEEDQGKTKEKSIYVRREETDNGLEDKSCKDEVDHSSPRLNVEKQNSASSLISAVSLQRALVKHDQLDSRWKGTFRTGILKLIRDPGSWAQAAGVGIVANIVGDADQVFRAIDTNGNGEIDRQELKHLYEILECTISDEELNQVFETLDVEKTGIISKKEFLSWYTSSEELIRSQVQNVFDRLDLDHSGTIDKQELKALLIQLDPHLPDTELQAAIEEIFPLESKEELTLEEFSEWYEKSLLFERHKQLVEDDMQGAWKSLVPPCGDGMLAWIQYILVVPIVVVLVLTIPDVRIPGRSKFCYLSFLLAVSWVGVFSYFMVYWAEIVGYTVGIPSVIMGLTVLAGGTSVPDLLTSVIVARKGHGDMALSSSIGSNIFDILVGLPVPWILYTAWPSTPEVVSIGSEGTLVSLFLLLGMLVFVVVVVHCQGWKLTKTLGFLMMLFYIGYLVQAIMLELPFETCK